MFTYFKKKLSVFLCAFLLCSTSAQADIVTDALKDTQAGLLKSGTDMPRCFLPQSIIRKSQVHFLEATYKSDNVYQDALTKENYNIIDVNVKKTGAPIVLMLTGHAKNTIWNVSTEDGVDIAGVHLYYRFSEDSGKSSYIRGIDSNVPITKSPHVTIRGRGCYSEQADDKTIVGGSDDFTRQISFLAKVTTEFAHFPTLGLRIEGALRVYADKSASSHQFVDGAKAEISNEIIKEFKEVKQSGKAALEAFDPYWFDKPPEDTSVVEVPFDVDRSVNGWMWLIENGYAERTTVEIGNKLCELDQDYGRSFGIDYNYKWRGRFNYAHRTCRWSNGRWSPVDKPKGIVLKRNILAVSSMFKNMGNWPIYIAPGASLSFRNPLLKPRVIDLSILNLEFRGRVDYIRK